MFTVHPRRRRGPYPSEKGFGSRGKMTNLESLKNREEALNSEIRTLGNSRDELDAEICRLEDELVSIEKEIARLEQDKKGE